MNGSEPRPNDATLVTIAAATVADAAVAALRAAADERDLAQEVRGIDSLPEREIQPVLATGFEAAGLHPLREVRFPQRAGEPVRSVGTRCDFVLRTIDAPLDLGDDVDAEDDEPDEGPGLFAKLDPEPVAPPIAMDPESAFWLEVKTGAACRDLGDAGDLSTLPKRTTVDLARLAHAGGIRHAAVLVVAFGPDEATLAHDAHALDRHAAEQGLPTLGAIVRTFPLTDRHGNAAGLVALIPVGRA
jgi:hypothetical protein